MGREHLDDHGVVVRAALFRVDGWSQTLAAGQLSLHEDHRGQGVTNRGLKKEKKSWKDSMIIVYPASTLVL